MSQRNPRTPKKFRRYISKIKNKITEKLVVDVLLSSHWDWDMDTDVVDMVLRRVGFIECDLSSHAANYNRQTFATADGPECHVVAMIERIAKRRHSPIVVEHVKQYKYPFYITSVENK